MESFIERANAVHDNKYDYSKVNYVNSKTKIIIICREHGEYITTPSVHLRSGCKYCATQRRAASKSKTTEQFISECVEVHGKKYDYGKTQYKNKRTPVTVTCRIHGNFEQLPGNHLSSNGCYKCSRIAVGKRRLGTKNSRRVTNTEEFIKQARKIHGDLFAYQKTEYVRSANAVVITCPIHGDFNQMPNNHLTGFGCSKCQLEKLSKKFSYGNAGFIARSKRIHGDQYDYSCTKYVKTGEKVDVICKKHGKFQVYPLHHIRGVKCRQCHSEEITLTKEEFIKKSIAIHGDFYDYSNVVYVDNNTKVEIKCPKHGSFEQLPRSHATSTGAGCTKCNVSDLWSLESLTDSQKAAPNGTYVIVLNSSESRERFIKIGISNNPKRRYNEITRQSGYRIEPLFYFESTTVDAIEFEQELHLCLIDYKYRPRKYFAGITECFNMESLNKLVDIGILHNDDISTHST